MRREIIQTTKFERDVQDLIAKKKLNIDDFEEFKKSLAENPEQGDTISGTGGLRKTRLKSASKGKRGGFRVCYLDIESKLILFLVYIYAKNEKDDLSTAEKVELKQFAEAIRRRVNNE